MYKVADNAAGHVFVNGTTRSLESCTQEDLAVLHQNGDSRVQLVKAVLSQVEPTGVPEKKGK
ncbi:hypothetical protein GCM10027275_50590 [Rhabdobacter roseus]|uniref:Uncharacterized protein n=1 Tax=Rhabdobacter roseus TaxID=1655419 RepID=A0A840TZR8_9BACT|nr:hypothetical protein [Rhabdobacter roseus]MBB5287132.1 hypothetical protein [Rhabdobacter roseus]